MRKIILIIKNSDKKHEDLKTRAKAANIECELIIDIKIRWNSLYLMIEHFLILLPFIKDTLIEFNLANLLEDLNISLLETTKMVLYSLNYAVNKLSASNSELLLADSLYMFVTKIRRFRK